MRKFARHGLTEQNRTFCIPNIFEQKLKKQRNFRGHLKTKIAVFYSKNLERRNVSGSLQFGHCIFVGL